MSYAPLCVDEIERRPIVVAKAAPDSVVAIDRHRIGDASRLQGALHIVDILLEWEFGRVHADDHQSAILVFLGPAADIGKLTQPVDAGVGPEIDEHDLAAQCLGRERRRVQPLIRLRERGQLGRTGRRVAEEPVKEGERARGCRL